MRRHLTFAVLASFMPMPALAGGPTLADPEPPMAAPVEHAGATDWSGPYAGVMGGIPSGHMQYFVLGLPETRESVDGSLMGAFAGFNIQRGQVVYGGEIAYSVGDVEFEPGYGFTNFLDLKGRLGYAAGKALVYGTVGWSMGDWKEEGFDSLSSSGPAYGAGVDVQLSDRVLLGVEYLWRAVESEDFPAPIPQTSVHGDFGTVSLRLGIKF